MTITKAELLHHIKAHPGQTKIEIAENFSGPGYQFTVFHVAGLLQTLMKEGAVVRETKRGKQVYRVVSPRSGNSGSAA